MSDTQKSDAPSTFETIRPVLVLVAICVVAGALLGVVYDFYGEPIREVRAERDGHVLYVNTALSAPVGAFQVAVAWADSEVKM
jgi:hypothetical protein